jgi:hypothetical protein
MPEFINEAILLQTYNMSSVDLDLGVFSGDQCLGAFFDLNLSPGSAAVISWVIGGAFLKNVYSYVSLHVQPYKRS